MDIAQIAIFPPAPCLKGHFVTLNFYSRYQQIRQITVSTVSKPNLNCSDRIETVRKIYILYQPLKNFPLGVAMPTVVLPSSQSLPTKLRRGTSWWVGKEAVVEVKPVRGKSIWAPLTVEGMLLVDGFLVSCYTSFSHVLWHLALLNWLLLLSRCFQECS